MQPTKKQYEEAKNDKKNMTEWIRMELRRQETLLDELADIRDNLRLYRQTLEKAKEIIMFYEAYEEAKGNNVER